MSGCHLPAPSYVPDYFSIPDILATQERVPCVAGTDLPSLGFLDPGSDMPDLKQGTKLEMPLWMAEGLLKMARNHLTLDVPKIYKGVHREIVEADSLVLDLHKLGPYYYEFGRHLIPYASLEGEDIGECLGKCFTTRFMHILDSALNCKDGESLQATAKMDELERTLFQAGQRTRKGMEIWMSGKTNEILTSSLVTSHRKRKAAHLGSKE